MSWSKDIIIEAQRRSANDYCRHKSKEALGTIRNKMDVQKNLKRKMFLCYERPLWKNVNIQLKTYIVLYKKKYENMI